MLKLSESRIIIIILYFVYLIVCYYKFFITGLLPIPADNVVGLYYPMRDSVRAEYPSGVPYKNFLITDPVRQQYVWRLEAIDQLKKLELPLWNRYSFAGSPLLANFQSAVFYPLNIFLFFGQFPYLWSLLVISQSVLGFIFMFFYLKKQSLSDFSSFLGGMVWSGSGFFVAWLEWNTTIHVVLWLPLVLVSIDSIIEKNKINFWSLIFVFALFSSFTAGYLQPFVYVLILSNLYLIYKIILQKKFQILIRFFLLEIFFICLILPQFIATLKLTLLSARDIDQAIWQKPDWFIPWPNMWQMIIPDIFGNPATLNYFGVWNYLEFVSYISIGGLFCVLLSPLYIRKNPVIIFWLAVLSVGLLFGLATPLGKLPYSLNLPFISSMQPSRIIVIIEFACAILAAYGFEGIFNKYPNRSRYTKFIFFIPLILVSLGAGWAYLSDNIIGVRNSILPLMFATFSFICLVTIYKLPALRKFCGVVFLLIVVVDLARFFIKYESFSKVEWLYPQTKTTTFLQKETKESPFRVAVLDDEIMPGNFSIPYKLEFVNGYDPLYLKNFGEFAVSLKRDKSDRTAPYGFNRIISPANYRNHLFDLLNVKYLITTQQVNTPEYEFVLQEGQTKLYRNINPFPRAKFIPKVKFISNHQNVLDIMYGNEFNPDDTAIVLSQANSFKRFNVDEATVKITDYDNNMIKLTTKNPNDGFLFLADVYYPAWNVYIDNIKSQIHPTNYLFRGVEVPSGEHTIIFRIDLQKYFSL